MEPQAMLALTVSRNFATTAHSALPHAPVAIADDTAHLTGRLRHRTAATLRRAADLISPPDRFTAVPVSS